MGRLSTYVWVADEKGRRTLFAPGDDVPAWATGLIRNPRAWADADAPAPAPAAPAAEVPPEPVDDPAPATSAAPVGTPPPRNGKGSSRAAWAAYATSNGVTPAEDDQRDEIIDALDEAGIPT